MTRKFLCVMQDDPELKAALEDLDALKKAEEETLAFLKKNAKVHFDRLMDQKGVIWTKIADRMKALGKIPADYQAWGTEGERAKHAEAMKVVEAGDQDLLFLVGRNDQPELPEGLKNLLASLGMKI